MIPSSFYIIGIALYFTVIAGSIIVVVVAHKKYNDRDFLKGILVATAIGVIINVIAINFLFYSLGIPFIIPGIAAGWFNETKKRGTLSGAVGAMISWVFLSSFLLFLLFSWFFLGLPYFLLLLLLSILFSGIGGAIGSVIRGRFKGRKASENPEVK